MAYLNNSSSIIVRISAARVYLVEWSRDLNIVIQRTITSRLRLPIVDRIEVTVVKREETVKPP